MFSYRHGFHAGAHSDVLKHLSLIAVLKHMTQKDTALTVIDTHAGAGLYRLDGDFATTSHEADNGIRKLLPAMAAPASGKAEVATTAGASSAPAKKTKPAAAPVEQAQALKEYVELVAKFNSPSTLKVYPGSPFVIHQLLRNEARDKLKLFELHPADHKALAGNIAQLEAGRQIAVAREDGFEGLKAFLPPPARRALVLIDPSYEVKTDYQRVSACIQDCLLRFPTGTYMVWYPVIPRPEAHELPKRLKTLAKKAGKPFLHATLAIGADDKPNPVGDIQKRPGLTASGVFIINPPHTLAATLEPALTQLLAVLRRGRGAGYTVTTT